MNSTGKSHLPFRDYASFLAARFDGKVQKLSVDGGFGCPNRDGTIGRGGCTYCNNATFTPPYCSPCDSVTRQLQLGKAFFGRKYPDMRYLAYFQSHTNTHAPLPLLRQRFEEALAVEGIVGLVIGTRPDCAGNDVLDYLASLPAFVIMEYGIETTDDRLLQLLHRGHTFAQAADAVCRTAERGICTAAHLILGLPGQTREQMTAEATRLSALPIDILKLHQLQIVKDTPMAGDYALHPDHYPLFERPEDYADVLIDFLRHLRPDITLERFTSQSPDDLLIAPRWGMKNHVFVSLLRRRLTEGQAWQGQLYNQTASL